MAQRQFNLVYIRDPWTFITGEDGEEACPDFDNDDLETSSNAPVEKAPRKKDLTLELGNLRLIKDTMQRIRDQNADVDEYLTLVIEHAMGAIEICSRHIMEHHETAQHLHPLAVPRSTSDLEPYPQASIRTPVLRRPVPVASSLETQDDTIMLDHSFYHSNNGLDQSFPLTNSSFNTPGHQDQPRMQNNFWWE